LTKETIVRPITHKPTRKELVAVIQELQDLIGCARGAALNDRDPNRMDSVQRPLEQGFNLCVEALSFDPPNIPK
jgi:hypothetical protein